MKVAEASNTRTLPSFHYLRQHDIVERSSQPSKVQSIFNRNPGQVFSPSYGCNNDPDMSFCFVGFVVIPEQMNNQISWRRIRKLEDLRLMMEREISPNFQGDNGTYIACPVKEFIACDIGLRNTTATAKHQSIPTSSVMQLDELVMEKEKRFKEIKKIKLDFLHLNDDVLSSSRNFLRIFIEELILLKGSSLSSNFVFNIKKWCPNIRVLTVHLSSDNQRFPDFDNKRNNLLKDY
uniref:Uncharacterized protein n=1 Tax=Tanacetum cinerariifolium TaxID=118510 RepID=A0A6L2MXT4_TANCI|nr:hypothetical protein [Tanacetum cinerariifolium]